MFTISPDIGLLALRIGIASIFFIHGPKKISGFMGQFMIFIGIAETVGAAAVLVGLLTKWAALGLGIIMAGAIYKKIDEWHVPFTTMENTGWEFDLIILATCIALMTFGAGTYSVDTLLEGAMFPFAGI